MFKDSYFQSSEIRQHAVKCIDYVEGEFEDLKQLYDLESGNMVKMSSLNEISLAPKPVERQRVFFCLRVFCDKTYHAETD